jgi:Rrf2 family protein
MGLKLTRATDYAVRAMIHLACLPEHAHALRDDVARSQDIPSSFMAKILRNLVQARLLVSSRGVNGGFALACPASDISMLQIVEAVEGPVAIVNCVDGGSGCIRTQECPAAPVWVAVQESVRSILSKTSVEDLVSAPRRNGRVSMIPHLQAVTCGANVLQLK